MEEYIPFLRGKEGKTGDIEETDKKGVWERLRGGRG